MIEAAAAGRVQRGPAHCFLESWTRVEASQGARGWATSVSKPPDPRRVFNRDIIGPSGQASTQASPDSVFLCRNLKLLHDQRSKLHFGRSSHSKSGRAHRGAPASLGSLRARANGSKRHSGAKRADPNASDVSANSAASAGAPAASSWLGAVGRTASQTSKEDKEVSDARRQDGVAAAHDRPV